MQLSLKEGKVARNKNAAFILLLFFIIAIFAYEAAAIEDEDEQYPTIDTERPPKEDETVKYIIPTGGKAAAGQERLMNPSQQSGEAP